MNNISEILSRQVTELLTIKFSNILNKLNNELVDKYKVDKDILTNIWNEIAPDIKLDLNKNNKNNKNDKNDDDTLIKEGCCTFLFKKGARKGELCNKKVAKNSTNFCSIHNKNKELKSSRKKEPIKDECKFVFKKGGKKGEKCTNIISKSSKMGYCILHKKEEKELIDDEDKKTNSENDTPKFDLKAAFMRARMKNSANQDNDSSEIIIVKKPPIRNDSSDSDSSSSDIDSSDSE